MTPHEASARWQQQQAATLRKSYQAGWETGRANYRSEKATPPATTAAVPPPTKPPSAAMLRALGPALASLASMGTAIATIVPTAAQIAAAGGFAAAIPLAVSQYLASNAYRLAGGASAAWAGEQHGYVQAAAADGLLLDWELDASANHCADCPALAGLPPMPLDQWPTMPGDGATECAAGCKCSMRAVAAPMPVLTADQHEVISRLGNVQPALIAA